MNARSLVAPAVILAAVAGCDTPACNARLLDACQKARDLASFVGTEIAASSPTGNIVIGESDAHHATGLVSIAVRASSGSHSAPRLNDVVLRSDSAVGNSAYPVDGRRNTGISFDFSAGGFRGARVGETRVGAIDLLGNVVILPTFDAGDFRSRPTGVGFGFGVRLGVIGETRVLPAPKDLHLMNTFVGPSMTKPSTFVTLGVRVPAGRTLDRGR